MNESKRPEPIDSRIHAYLDGEMAPAEAAAFEGELRAGTVPDHRLNVLRRIEAWCRATRPRSPSALAESVGSALADPPRPLAPRDATPSAAGVAPAAAAARETSWNDVLGRLFRRWAWVPAAAAALLLIVRFGTHSPDPPPLQSTTKSGTPGLIAGNGPPESTKAVESGTVRYNFHIRADDAKRVCLVGDFNQWRVCDAALVRVEEDLWTISMELPRGRHEYMFVVDGSWVTDPGAVAYVNDGFGNRNALLVL